MISQKTIDAIFDAARIDEVVEEFVDLKKRGINFIGLCPFHDEKTPSFTVSPSRNIYKCFGCGKGGNPISFVMEHEGYTYPEALRYLASRYQIPIEETGVPQEYQQEKHERDSLYLINDYARDFYSKQLHETDMGKSVGLGYFRERGLLLKTIEKFELGYAPGERDTLTRNAVAAGYNIEFLRKLGLTTDKDRDFFFGRVIFPIHNVSGKVVAFAGRQLTNSRRSPKYINSKESDIYHKSKVLYGLHLAKQSIRKEDNCILVEGYTDVLALYQSGIENVVASSGTALTTNQIKLIKRYSKEVTVLFDGDPAGVKAALRGIDLILEQDMNVRLVMLPDKEDPDSYLQKVGATAFRQYLQEKAEDFILFKTNLAIEEAGSDPVKKAELIKGIVTSLACIPDPIKRSVYIRQCATQLQVDESLLVSETHSVITEKSRNERINKLRQARRDHAIEDEVKANQKKSSTAQHSTTAHSQHQERDIVRILMLHGEQMMEEEANPVKVSTYVISQIQEVIPEFENDLYSRIVTEYGKRLAEGLETNTKYFIQHPDEAISQLAIEFCSSPYEYSENWEKKWDILLQTQPIPEENGIQDSVQALLRFMLRKFQKLREQNREKIKEMQKAKDQEGLLKHLQVQKMLDEQRNEIAEKLNTVVL